MKLTDEELRQYYERYGIRREDLLSTTPVSLAELPADLSLSEEQRRDILSILGGWNRLDDMSKIDAAYAMERRVLTKKDPPHLKRLEAWAGYLLLGRRPRPRTPYAQEHHHDPPHPCQARLDP